MIFGEIIFDETICKLWSHIVDILPKVGRIPNMKRECLDGFQVRDVSQIALVVKDAQSVLENYWNIMGIGPWSIYLAEPPTAYERNYHGVPVWGREKVAIAQVGTIQLKLIQPIDGKSIYADHLSNHGEGLHHIQFIVNDVSMAVRMLAQKGYRVIQDEQIGDLKYDYVGIEPLHCIFKFGTVKESTRQNYMRYPESGQERPAKVTVKAITQVALAVKDVQITLEQYWNILGIGAWDVVTALPPALYDTTYHGKPVKYTFRIALTQLGAAQLELMQPLSGKSVHADVIRQQGEGLHHMQFQVDDIDETTKIMARAGFRTLASGGYSGGGFAFYDTTNSLKCVWEVLQVPKQMSIDYRWPEELKE